MREIRLSPLWFEVYLVQVCCPLVSRLQTCTSQHRTKIHALCCSFDCNAFNASCKLGVETISLDSALLMTCCQSCHYQRPCLWIVPKPLCIALILLRMTTSEPIQPVELVQMTAWQWCPVADVTMLPCFLPWMKQCLLAPQWPLSFHLYE